MLTSLEQLAALPVAVERVHIEALKDEVYLRGFSGTAQDAFEEMLLEGRSIATTAGQPETEQRFWISQYTIRLVALALCDEQGRLLCPTAIEREALGNLPAAALTEIGGHVRRMNGLNQTVDAVLEGVEKNSNAVPSGDFGSASPLISG